MTNIPCVLAFTIDTSIDRSQSQDFPRECVPGEGRVRVTVATSSNVADTVDLTIVFLDSDRTQQFVRLSLADAVAFLIENRTQFTVSKPLTDDSLTQVLRVGSNKLLDVGGDFFFTFTFTEGVVNLTVEFVRTTDLSNDPNVVQTGPLLNAITNECDIPFTLTLKGELDESLDVVVVSYDITDCSSHSIDLLRGCDDREIEVTTYLLYEDERRTSNEYYGSLTKIENGVRLSVLNLEVVDVIKGNGSVRERTAELDVNHVVLLPYILIKIVMGWIIFDSLSIKWALTQNYAKLLRGILKKEQYRPILPWLMERSNLEVYLR